MEAAERKEQPGDLVKFDIEKARKEGLNILIPTAVVETLSEFHQPVVEYVKLSPDPKDGDVYYHFESKLYPIAKQGLMKLSVCAGLAWDPMQTKRVDDRKDRNYIAYQAVGGVRKTDGSMVWFKAEYDLDFEVIEEELRAGYERKARDSGEKLTSDDDRKRYVDFCVNRDLLHKRKHKIALAESGAMNRVVRSLLGLKAGYTKQELGKPFVVARIVFKPDYSDPQIRRLMIQESIKSVTSVYGGEVYDYGRGGDAVEPIAVPVQENGTNLDAGGLDEKDFESGEDGAPDGLSHNEADFAALSVDEQVKTLVTLATRKGYDLKQLKKPIIKFTDQHRMDFFKKLNEMPDPRIDDEIPF